MTTSHLKVGSASMPALGLGLWKVPSSAASAMVYDAISEGYRHFDSACDYGNEPAVGEGLARALRDGLTTRDALWVTSKLWNTYHRREHVRAACERSLRDLKLDYLDLYLIHFPIALRYVDFETRYPPEWIFDPSAPNPTMVLDRVPLQETWEAMEALVTAGLVKAIGVCNYNTGLIHDLMNYATVPPAMLQVEMHPQLPQHRLLKTAQSYGLPVTAFSPLGAGSYVELSMAEAGDSLLQADPVVALARRFGKTPAQVLLRWGLERGTALIPKSTRPERRRENLELFDFALDEDAKAALAALETGRRFNDPGDFCADAFHRFHAIYD